MPIKNLSKAIKVFNAFPYCLKIQKYGKWCFANDDIKTPYMLIKRNKENEKIIHLYNKSDLMFKRMLQDPRCTSMGWWM